MQTAQTSQGCQAFCRVQAKHHDFPLFFPALLTTQQKTTQGEASQSPTPLDQVFFATHKLKAAEPGSAYLQQPIVRQ
jgi:hypothetical protein